MARRAADLRAFHFGHMTEHESARADTGELVLHIQCPWRLEGPTGIVTGRSDLWEPADPSENFDPASWDYDTHGNLQDRRIRELFGSGAPGEGSSVNNGHAFIVEDVDADEFGGAVLSLSGGYRIVIFPSGSVGEDWRLFRPHVPGHFVVSGGQVETSSDEPG